MQRPKSISIQIPATPTGMRPHEYTTANPGYISWRNSTTNSSTGTLPRRQSSTQFSAFCDRRATGMRRRTIRNGDSVNNQVLHDKNNNLSQFIETTISKSSTSTTLSDVSKVQKQEQNQNMMESAQTNQGFTFFERIKQKMDNFKTRCVHNMHSSNTERFFTQHTHL